MASTDEATPADRLAAARARKAAALVAREALEKPSDEALALAAEREADEAEATAKAIKEHGAPGVEIALIPSPKGLVILKRPDPIKFMAFQDSLGDKSAIKVSDAIQQVEPCVVYPELLAFHRLTDDRPGLITHALELIGMLAGVRQGALSGK